jgi:hypothetical protein
MYLNTQLCLRRDLLIFLPLLYHFPVHKIAYIDIYVVELFHPEQ